MKRFAQLFEELDASSGTADKVAALVRYFSSAPAEDAAWALALLTGRRVKRAVNYTQLYAWAAETSGYPEWLIGESHGAVGDFSEVLSLILPPPTAPADLSLREVIQGRIVSMARHEETHKKAMVLKTWDQLDQRGKFIFHKLISATFRVGVSRLLAVRALSQVAGVAQEEMDHRLMGEWSPTAEFYRSLMRPPDEGGDGRGVNWNPYPFFLAHQLEDTAFIGENLGPVAQWQAEWKWDGIRGQLIKRAGRVALWSRGEELLTERFPDLLETADRLPDGTVLDGELLAWENGRPLPFADLQHRINKRQPTGLLFADVPVIFRAYDQLEERGEDLRARPLRERRAILEGVVRRFGGPLLQVSEVLEVASWEALAELRSGSRDRNVEGIMLKHLDSAYGVGRTKTTLIDSPQRAGWWKWKVDPYLVDCVLTVAQRGSGRRASLFTDYTFAVWTGPQGGEGELVPIAKAYSGLTDQEILKVDAFVREHTTGRLQGGGGRLVEPRLVFEIAFEGIAASPRHKSGVATRFPRMKRWRTDKKSEEADTLGFVKGLLAQHVRSSGVKG
ncbi:MAG: ATP-dependent DNA ligase [Phycisphaerales bacterium]|nr:ATP-dependent DNA ligase [Phycisphaerales bacterium]